MHFGSSVQVSTKWLLVLVVLVFVVGSLAIPVEMGQSIPLPFSYEWHKWLHILGAILFLGNIIITGFWMVIAMQMKQEPVIRFAAVTVNWADVFFTAPGIILVLGNGILLSQQWGGLYGITWLRWALALFALSGIIWVGFLIPLQDRMARLARSSEPLPRKFYVSVYKWYFWGIIATILPLISMILMVLKPNN